MDNKENPLEMLRRIHNRLQEGFYHRSGDKGVWDAERDIDALCILADKLESQLCKYRQVESEGRLVESDKIFLTIDTMILRANELNRISENNDVSPIEAGRASWERRGILFSLKTITETTGIIQFEDLLECRRRAKDHFAVAEAALAAREGKA